jgi:hypothetical protein
MAKHSRTKRMAIPVQDLPQPPQELTEEQAGRVWGGKVENNRLLKEQVRIAQRLMEGGSTGQSYTLGDLISDLGG